MVHVKKKKRRLPAGLATASPANIHVNEVVMKAVLEGTVAKGDVNYPIMPPKSRATSGLSEFQRPLTTIYA